MASNFSLLYIAGINDVDTPVFPDRLEQYIYMSGKVVSTPDEGFYVPHFKDTIDVEIEYLTLDNELVSINYLFIYYLGKYYYYFIDAIEYINESIARIYISMDSIQTYMFDLDFIQVHLTRESIRRWESGGYINRNYLRENLSDGVFEEKSKKYFRHKYDFSSHSSDRDDKETGILICKKTPSTPPTWYYGLKFGTEIVTTSYEYYFTGIYDGDPTKTISWLYDLTQQYEEIIPIQNANNFSRTNDDVVMYYFLPFSPFKTKIKYDSSLYRNVITCPQYISYGGVSKLFSLTQNNKEDLVEYYDVDTVYMGGVTAGDAFDRHKVPALLDEFYTKYEFGEDGCKSVAPLHLVTLPILSFRYVGDPFTGKRLYYITAAVTSVDNNASTSPYGIKDVMNTLACANSVITLDLSTEAYIRYYSYNKASTWAGLAMTIGDLAKFAGGIK